MSQPDLQSAAQDREAPGGAVERMAISLGDYSSLAFPFAFFLTIWEIVARTVFQSPTTWTLEIALLACGIAYILVGPQATALRTHIGIDLVLQAVSPRTQRALRLISAIASIAFGAVITYSGWRLAAPLIEGLERTGSALNSPAPSVIKILIPLAGLLWVVLEVIRFLRMFRK